jgi:hypothetical protein
LFFGVVFLAKQQVADTDMVITAILLCQRWFGIPQNRWFGIPQLKCSVWLVLTSCRLNPACATLTRLVAEDRATLESDLSATPSPV